MDFYAFTARDVSLLRVLGVRSSYRGVGWLPVGWVGRGVRWTDGSLVVGHVIAVTAEHWALCCRLVVLASRGFPKLPVSISVCVELFR